MFHATWNNLLRQASVVLGANEGSLRLMTQLGWLRIHRCKPEFSYSTGGICPIFCCKDLGPSVSASACLLAFKDLLFQFEADTVEES